MKKFAILLIAVVASVAGAAAMNLKEAFGALSNLPNVTEVKPDYNLPVDLGGVEVEQISAAYNLDAQNIALTGNAAYAILNQVPLNYMINGANNGLVCAAIYTTPGENDHNDILVAVMSGYRGSVVFIYGTVSSAGASAIQQAPVQIEGAALTMHAAMPDGNEFNINLTKGR